MHALPMITPSVVKNARILFAQSASSATIQVSFRSIMIVGVDYNKPKTIKPADIGYSIHGVDPIAVIKCAHFYLNRGVKSSCHCDSRRLILLSLASTLLPRAYCADQEPRKRDNSLPLPKIFPGPHGVFQAIRARRNAKEDRSCREPWRGRTSATIPPRRDHFFSSPTVRRGKNSNGGHRRRFVRRRQSRHSFSRGSGGPGS